MPITRPAFTHPVFDRLYERDYFIDDAVLREILALGPEAAVPELLKITASTLAQHAAVQRTDYFHSFYFLHALYLLHELGAPEALDVYARLLRLDSESTDYWFGDYLAEEVPGMLAQAAQSRLPELLALLEDARLPLLHRLIPAAALVRLVREQPGLRPAISAFLQQYLRGIIAHGGLPSAQRPPKSAAFDHDLDSFLGLLLAEIQDAGLRELEPEMREVYRLGLVDESIAGGEADIDYEDHNPPQPVPDIFTRYQQLRAAPDNYSPFHPDAAALARRRAEEEARYAQLRREALVQQPRLAEPKIGRNDPCFCGSGKKFKKCHGA